MKVGNKNQPIVDKEWEQLIIEAKTIGLTIDEVRKFLLEHGSKKKSTI